ncbi:MAG: hypothetical protein KC619_31715 [Myxococcales bacterium]|nr:hypothetical protein [Myxococcales bacterium]
MSVRLIVPLLAVGAAGCFFTPASGDACTNTCRWAHDGECDDGGDGADYAVCDLGTDCHDCGPRGSSSGTPGTPGTTDPGSPPPTGSTDPIDYGLPEGFPPLSARYEAHATWRHDDSGFELLPNRSYRGVDELPTHDGVATFGAIPEAGEHLIEAEDAAAGHTLRLYLRDLTPGTYQVTGFDGRIERVEQRNGTYTYVSDVEGGSGVVEIVGNNGMAVWGTFAGRFCYRPTPGVNCSSVYEGRFSAVVR